MPANTVSDNPVDPERPHEPAPFNRPEGYSGQGYTRDDEAEVGRQDGSPSASVAADADIPPDNGVRATVNPMTGEVHGAGIGAGGGQEGEDMDSSSSSGDMFPLTGGEGSDKTPGDLGPPQRDETSYL